MLWTLKQVCITSVHFVIWEWNIKVIKIYSKYKSKLNVMQMGYLSCGVAITRSFITAKIYHCWICRLMGKSQMLEKSQHLWRGIKRQMDMGMFLEKDRASIVMPLPSFCPFWNILVAVWWQAIGKSCSKVWLRWRRTIKEEWMD